MSAALYVHFSFCIFDSVGFGIAYSWRKGNAKAYKSGIGKVSDSRAFLLCFLENDL